ncbi:MAG: hypothetical protein FJ014_08310 [Chloroflexi bacterium]|nr:hypothetical protein [Chloroflexota bacterium]
MSDQAIRKSVERHKGIASLPRCLVASLPHSLTLLALALLFCLAGCRPAWEATVFAPDGSAFLVDSKVLASLSGFAEEGHGLPLERVLWTAGHRVIEHLIVSGPEGARHEFDWAAVADDAWWEKDGKLSIGGESLPVSHLEVEPPPLLEQVEADITDIAPTVAGALGLPSPAQATGRALEAPPASHVLLLFLDGLGYVRYVEARDTGLIPNLAALGEPLVGLTVYPPCTNVASAALLTGAPPQVNGVDQRGIRKTEVETLFDVANAAGRQVVAVEGEALAFNLRNAEMQLSGDRDGNGSTDDNVLANALAVLDEGMPDLFFVHFHGIDDAGHTYGPNAPEEEAVIHEVDAAVGQLLAALPADTLIIIFADHGMHVVEEEGRLGNHEHLIERDMFIPVWMVGN